MGQRIGVRAAGLLQGRRWESRSQDGPGPGESSHGAHQVAGGAGVVWKASAALPGEHAVRCAKRRRGDISEGWMCDAVLDTGARLGMWWEPALNLVAKPYFKGDSSEPLTCMYDVVYLEIEFVRYRILFSAK